MYLLLILPILVGGFVVCNSNPYYYYKLHRYEGQYLYLKSAYLGVISLITFSVIALLCNYLLPSSYQVFGHDIPLDVVAMLKSLLEDVVTNDSGKQLTSFAWIVLLSVGSVLTSYLWAVASKIVLVGKCGSLEHSKILLMSKVLSDSPMDRLLFESYLYSRPLILSLECGKVYVGTISSLGEPNEAEGMDQEISLIPLMSGFRRKDTLSVDFTTYYDAIDTDLNIVIRQEQVLLASVFYFDVYKKLNSEPIVLLR